MPERLTITKTHKLYINGAFPRSESGRSLPAVDRHGALLGHVCHASRKDLREAVEAASAAQGRWAAAPAYLRGQILYRMAEMLEGQAEDLTSLVAATCTGGRTAARREVETAIDRLVCFAGWTDKYPQILGGQNPVDGPYYNFTIPEPSGVVGVVCPDEPALLGLISLLAPPLCAGNALVVIASPVAPLPAVTLAEVCATSDVPAGVVNILTGSREDLLEPLAGHRQVNAISAANLPRSQARVLELGAAENLKRVHVIRRTDRQWRDAETCESPWSIEPFVEMKTIWHPSGA